MAPKKTQTGATATTRRSTAKAGARASSSSRTRATSSKSTTPRKTATAAKAAPKKAAARKRPILSAGSWWLVPAGIVAALLVFAWLYYPVVRVQYRETRERARLETELASLEARNDRLQEQVDKLKTPEGVEDYARSQLGLVKAGENAVVVVDGTAEKKTTTSPDIEDPSAEDPVGPWTAFLDLVFGVR